MARATAQDRYRQRAPARRIVFISGDNTRTVTVKPAVAGTVAALAAVLSIAFLAATTYLVLRDDLINVALSRNARLQQAYEDRIATLRSEIDKIASRQILDQVAYDEKVDRLLAAQRSLGDRQKLISDLVSRAEASGLLDDGGSSTATAPARGDRADAGSAAAGTAADDRVATLDAPFAALRNAPARHATTRGLDAAPTAAALVAPDGKIDVRAVGNQLAAIDAAQTETVRAVAAAAIARATAVKQIVGRLGVALDVAPTPKPAPDANLDAVGGPYVPLDSAEALSAAMVDAGHAFDTLGEVKRAVTRLPLEQPIPGADRTSNFGSRTDPFLGSVAFHAGIDFRSPSGTAVEATAPGRVVAAGPAGGYGNMVEVDHGGGLATRYAHLSRIDVEVGEDVRKGTVLGEVGSTGRSTGPHLHYETRVNGVAVNPETYLEAGDRIATLLR